MADRGGRRLLWASLADQRPGRELTWLSMMPGTAVTAVGSAPFPQGVQPLPGRYRRPVRRFVEAGALAWLRDVDDLPTDVDWVASLELCSLVTGQMGTWSRKHGVKQAVLTWENLVNQPLYHLPPYSRAFRRSLEADLFLCLVESARLHLLEHGVNDARIRVVAPGVDTTRFRPAEQAVDAPVVAFVSPLAQNKGIDTVLDAIRLLRRDVPDLRLLVLGRGPLEPMVRASAADAASGVEYLGAGDSDLVARTLQRANVFCTAPRATWKWNEQFGLAYLEAMSSGLPVVTTVCGTNDEAVREPNTRTANSAEALAEGLLPFVTNLELAKDVGRQNRARIESEHDLRTQTARMGDAFASVEGST